MSKLNRISVFIIILLFNRNSFAQSTVSFQQGVLPTAAYSGARDALIAGGASANTNYGALTSMSADNQNGTYGNNSSWLLLGFDVSSIPTTSGPIGATLTIYISDASSGVYELYEVLRPWTENGVTYNNYSGTNAWTTAGCGSAGNDYVNTVIGTTPTGATGSYNIVLNAAGINMIQNWIYNPSANNGIIIRDGNTDGLDIYTKEYTTNTSRRPRLTLALGSTLPIELLYFNANKQTGNKVLLDWMTATESGNDYFTIEKSSDAFSWEHVAKVKGAGNSTTKRSYQVIDEVSTNGWVYYRLKQTDFNGSYKYSGIQKIKIKKEDDNLIVYPNPSKAYFYINLNGTKPQKLELKNSLGQLMAIDVELADEGCLINGTILPDGVYYLIAYTYDEIKTLKLIKRSE